MPRKRRASIKDEERYVALRDEGMTKEKAARIANTPAEIAGRRGGRAKKPYEDWTREELYVKARKVGIEGRSSMNKGELIEALRSGS